MSTNERIRGRKLQTIRARVLRDNPLCVTCLIYGRVREAKHVDHILAIANGGQDDPYDDSNRQALCESCHADKTRKDLGYREHEQIGLDGYPIIRNALLKRPLSHEATERRMPSDLLRSRIPIVMLCGPPGSGKSTYLREHVSINDAVIDLDSIMSHLSGMPEHHTSADWLGKALDERNRCLRALADDTVHDKAWFIIACPDPQERKRWASMLGAEVIVLSTPLDECIRRIEADPLRNGHTTRMIKAANEWWNAQSI